MLFFLVGVVGNHSISNSSVLLASLHEKSYESLDEFV